MIKSATSVIALSCYAFALSGCIGGPITKPPGIVCGDLLPLYEPLDPTVGGETLLDKTIAAKRAASNGGPIVINILTLSGGGKYGAFGAGFLGGWSEAEANGGIVPLSREEIDIITGVSTGALLSSYAAAGNLSPTQGGSAALRAEADADAKAGYEVSDSGLFKSKGMLGLLTSNGLADPSGRLDKRVADMVTEYAPHVAKSPSDHMVLVGAANLTNGKFYVADLTEAAKKGPEANACYAEWLLASSAVPAQFPPRFIDGYGYVDGGVRFGAFLSNNVARVVRRTKAPGDELEGTQVKINLIALFNNPLTANSPSQNPDAAVACDQSTLANAKDVCPARKNNLLAVATRSAGDIMTNQVYLDSVYRLHRDLDASGILGISHFIYAPPQKIAEKGCKAATEDHFDRAFMDCLYSLGFEMAQDPEQWLSFEEMPRSRSAADR